MCTSYFVFILLFFTIKKGKTSFIQKKQRLEKKLIANQGKTIMLLN